MQDFELHPRLAHDCEVIADLALCRVLLMKDASYPWIIMVPKVDNIQEIHQLHVDDQQQLIKEVTFVSEKMEKLFHADKMNIGALGNMVPQLHIHVIARYKKDAAWPNPVWGNTPALAYGDDDLGKRIREIQEVLL